MNAEHGQTHLRLADLLEEEAQPLEYLLQTLIGNVAWTTGNTFEATSDDGSCTMALAVTDIGATLKLYNKTLVFAGESFAQSEQVQNVREAISSGAITDDTIADAQALLHNMLITYTGG